MACNTPIAIDILLLFSVTGTLRRDQISKPVTTKTRTIPMLKYKVIPKTLYLRKYEMFVRSCSNITGTGRFVNSSRKGRGAWRFTIAVSKSYPAARVSPMLAPSAGQRIYFKQQIVSRSFADFSVLMYNDFKTKFAKRRKYICKAKCFSRS